MYLCICKSVSDRQIREAVELGARTFGDLSIRLGVGIECGQCIDRVQECLDACLAKPTPADSATSSTFAELSPSPPAPLTPAPARAAWFAVDL